MEILEPALFAALIFFVAALVLLRILTKLGWHELRDALLQHAYKSFTFDGTVIPGVRPHRGARLVIRVLSPAHDERRRLVDQALAPEEPEPPLDHPRSVAAPVRATS